MTTTNDIAATRETVARSVTRPLRRFFRTPKGVMLLVLAGLLALAAPVAGVGRVAPGLLAAVLGASVLDTAFLRLTRGEWQFPSGAILSALFVALAWALGAAWALYWIVVEALDNGHTAAVAGEDESAAQDSAPDPWFVRIYQLGPLRRFADRLRSLSRPWRRELQLIADHPALALGFGLGIAALLAVPLVALFFRPAAVLGAVHLLGRVDEAERATP